MATILVTNPEKIALRQHMFSWDQPLAASLVIMNPSEQQCHALNNTERVASTAILDHTFNDRKLVINMQDC